MEQKLDLRIQKTYLALTNALLEMMSEMPFESIRVQELCDRAMVRKATFYKHFADKYELLAFIVREKIEEHNAEIPPAVHGDSPLTYYFGVVDKVFDFVRLNNRLIHYFAESKSIMLILNVLADQIIPDIQSSLEKDQRHGYKLPASPAVMAAFFVGAVSESVRRWLENGKQMEEAELKAQVECLLTSVFQMANG